MAVSRPMHFEQGWTKVFAGYTTTNHADNNVVGTITSYSTKATFVRIVRIQRGDRTEEEQEWKEFITTTFCVLPPRWLTRRGAIWNRQITAYPNSTVRPRSDPIWSLKPVYVLPARSRCCNLWRICLRHDLDALRRLLDRGEASVYHVDDEGGDMLTWAIRGAGMMLDFERDYLKLEQQLNDAIEFINFIIALGVDPFRTRVEGRPTAFLGPLWRYVLRSEGYPPSLCTALGNLRLLVLENLMTLMERNNLPRLQAMFWVTPNADLYIWGGLGTGYWDEIFPLGLDDLVRRPWWKVDWWPGQLLELAGVYCNSTCPLCFVPARNQVAFWVVSSPETVEKYISTKLHYLKTFLDLGLLDIQPGGPNCLVSALYHAAYQADRVFSLLLKRPVDRGGGYRDTSQAPWVYHRTRKCKAVGEFFNELLYLMLKHGWKYPGFVQSFPGSGMLDDDGCVIVPPRQYIGSPMRFYTPWAVMEWDTIWSRFKRANNTKVLSGPESNDSHGGGVKLPEEDPVWKVPAELRAKARAMGRDLNRAWKEQEDREGRPDEKPRNPQISENDRSRYKEEALKQMGPLDPEDLEFWGNYDEDSWYQYYPTLTYWETDPFFGFQRERDVHADQASGKAPGQGSDEASEETSEEESEDESEESLQEEVKETVMPSQSETEVNPLWQLWT